MIHRPFNKVGQVVTRQSEPACKNRIPQAARDFRFEIRVACDLVQMAFDLASKCLWLPSQADVVVQNLSAFIRREVRHIDYDLRLLDERER